MKNVLLAPYLCILSTKALVSTKVLDVSVAGLLCAIGLTSSVLQLLQNWELDVCLTPQFLQNIITSFLLLMGLCPLASFACWPGGPCLRTPALQELNLMPRRYSGNESRFRFLREVA